MTPHHYTPSTFPSFYFSTSTSSTSLPDHRDDDDDISVPPLDLSAFEASSCSTPLSWCTPAGSEADPESAALARANLIETMASTVDNSYSISTEKSVSYDDIKDSSSATNNETLLINVSDSKDCSSVSNAGKELALKDIEISIFDGDSAVDAFSKSTDTYITDDAVKEKTDKVTIQEVEGEDVLEQKVEDKDVLKQEVEEKEVLKQEVEEKEVLKQEIEEKEDLKQEIEDKKVPKQEVEDKEVPKQEVEDKEVPKQEVADKVVINLEVVDKVVLNQEVEDTKIPKQEVEDKDILKNELQGEKLIKQTLTEQKKPSTIIDVKTTNINAPHKRFMKTIEINESDIEFPMLIMVCSN